MFDHYGARTSHRADQASKPVTVELLPHLGQNEAETFKNTFSQRALDKFGFIEAWVASQLNASSPAEGAEEIVI